MSGCLAENTLVELVEGRLDAMSTASLHRHVDGCPPCRALLREVGGAFFSEGASASLPVAEHSSLSLPIAEPSAPSVDGAKGAALRRPRKVSLRSGDLVGPYRVLRQIGVGGMGVVFEALHERLRRRVAIKVLYPHYSENPQMVARLLNEARAANIVRHPAIVSSFEVGHLPSGEAYLVMEHLDGEPLRLRLQRRGGRLGTGGLRILRQVASAVGAAHGWGVVHRDLKPANIMLVPDPEMAGGERVKILDFGLAKLGVELREGGEADEEYSTHAGTILGTPAYMAPEQCQEAAQVDEKADVYSLGVMLFECESGRLPFSAKGAVDLMAMHIYVAAPGLRDAAPEASEALVRLVSRMLSKDPAARPNMAEVASELGRLDGPEDQDHGTAPFTATVRLPRPRPSRWWFSGAVALFALVALWLLRRPAPPPGHPMAVTQGERERPVEAARAGKPPLGTATTTPLAAPATTPAPRAKGTRRVEPAQAARLPAPPVPTIHEDWTDEKIRIFQ